MRPSQRRAPAVYRICGRVPRGKVTTFGDLAAFAGLARGAREVGWVLHLLPPGQEAVPWWRVVRSDGHLPRHAARETQAVLLREEGIDISAEYTLDLAAHRWEPVLEELEQALEGEPSGQ